MWITRGVLAILALAVTFLLSAQPAQAGECTGDCRDRLVQVGLHEKVVQLVADGGSTCALTEGGAVYCWGPAQQQPDPTGRNLLLMLVTGDILIAVGTTLVLVSRR